MSPPDGVSLLERLLEDPGFRARFHRNPTAAARDAGFPELAAEIARQDPEQPLEPLDVRESRSSAGGVLLAAAIEGLGLFELSEHLLPHLGAEDALAADTPARTASASAPVDPDDLADPADGTDVPDVPDELDADEPDAPDEPDDDADEADEEEPDEEEPDEEEPDEEEPDEEEPDEEEPDDEEAGDDSGDADDSDDSDDTGDADDADDPASEPDGADDADDADLEPIPGPDAYPGDAASREQIGAWMAHAAQKRGLPAELPVMASLVESGLRNLPGGDADSVGFFQMRMGIWNQGAYAGYAEQPERQLDWFLDHAEAVEQQRIARGLPVDDPDHYGEWIADVERPAEQYRGRYQLRWAEARQLLRRYLPDGDGIEDIAEAPAGFGPDPGPRAREAVAEARRQLGTPYRWGGSSPDTGFDCSGLLQWAYAKAGIQIPRVTDQQILASGAAKVDRKHLLPGDLVFFRDASGYVHHAGMSLGGDRFIEAPRTGLKVRISNLEDPYYAEQFAGARRFDAPVRHAAVEARVMPVLRPEDIDGR